MELPNNPLLDRLRQYCFREPFIVSCLLVAAVAFNLIFLYSSFATRISGGSDILLHTLLSEAVVEAIKNGQNFTDPWQGSMGMGHPMFHYYQHLPHVAVGFIYFLTFGLFSVAEIVRWSTYLLISIFPLSIYWSLRRFGFDQLVAAMGGLVASLVATNSIQGLGYSSYIGGAQGLYTQLWAMNLLPLALSAGYRVLRDGQGYFWAVLLLVATAMSHVLYGYMAFITLGVMTVLLPIRFKVPWNISNLSGRRGGTRAQRRRSLRSSGPPSRPQMADQEPATVPDSETSSFIGTFIIRVRRLLVIVLLVVAVASYFLVPFFLDLRFFNSSDLIDPRNYDSHGHSAVLRGLFNGDLFDFGRFPSLTILVFVGFVVCLLRGRRELYLIPLAIFLVWLLLYFGRPTWGNLTNVLPLSQNILMFRFIGGVHLGGILLMAVGLGASWRWALSRGNIWYPVSALILTVALLIPVFVERVSSLDDNADRLERCQQQEAAGDPDVTALFEELKQLPEGRVFAGKFVYNVPHWGSNYRSGCTLIQARALTEGLDTVAALFHRYSLTSDVIESFDETRLEHYNLFNVRYVIAPEGQIFPDFVEPVQQFGPHVLYRVETTGYFDLVGSELAFSGEKDDFLPAASSWLASGLPEAKQHPVVAMGSPTQEIPSSFSDAPDVISETEALAGPDRGTLLGEEFGSNYFTADVTVERASVLLLKAGYHPNWRATVDGKEADTVMLMPGFVGVELPPGEHQVRLEYKPRRLRAILLILGLLVLPAIAIAENRRRSIHDWLQPRLLGRIPSLVKRP